MGIASPAPTRSPALPSCYGAGPAHTPGRPASGAGRLQGRQADHEGRAVPHRLLEREVDADGGRTGEARAGRRRAPGDAQAGRRGDDELARGELDLDLGVETRDAHVVDRAPADVDAAAGAGREQEDALRSETLGAALEL